VTSPQSAAALVPREWREWIARLPPDGGPGGADWAAGLPRLLAEVLDDWGLVPNGPAMTGWTAVVVPVLREGLPFVLKVGWPHRDAAFEHVALRRWGGKGAVLLVAADPRRGALLLEALDPARDLEASDVDIDAACHVIGELLGRLNVPAPPQVRTLSGFAAAEVDRLSDVEDRLPRRFVDRVRRLVVELSLDPACDASLLHTDLHFGNVLAGTREPWLAIDPKPMAGHPGFELQPVLRNRVEELGRGSAFRHLVRRRMQVVCETAGIDQDAARLWTIVSSVFEASWSARDDDAEGVTFHLALAKALEE
jgi:streptomycin 6-kinase